VFKVLNIVLGVFTIKAQNYFSLRNHPGISFSKLKESYSWKETGDQWKFYFHIIFLNFHLKTFSRSVLITLVNTGHPVSIQGFVFISISKGLKSQVSMKSNPNNSKDGYVWLSSFYITDYTASAASS